jgi:hypothetical protein
MIKHEYRTDTLDVTASIERHLEAMEDANWELVTILQPREGGDRYIVVMRRPK